MLNYYKKIFMLTLRSEFAGGEIPSSLNEDSFKGDQLSDLKELKKSINDGKIDSEEARIISENIENIEGEAKKGLLEIAKGMLENGFSATDDKIYNSFKKIIESDGTTKIPEWGSITKIIEKETGEVFDLSKCNGVKVSSKIISVKYEHDWSFKDTLYLDYDNNGDIKINDNGWDAKANEDVKLKSRGLLDSTVLDDNIDIAQQEQTPAQQEQTPAQLRIEDIKELIKGHSNLEYNENDGRVYITLTTPNGESHRGYFTVSKHPQIKDEASLKPWVDYITNYLKEKYPKKEEPTTTKDDKEKETIEVKEDNSTGLEGIDIDSLSDEEVNNKLSSFALATKKKETLTTEEKKAILKAIKSGEDLPTRDSIKKDKSLTQEEKLEKYRKVISTVDLPATNKDFNGTYKLDSISSELIEEGMVSIKSGIVEGLPKSEDIKDNGYYKVEKSGETVVVTGERLRKMFKIDGSDKQNKPDIVNDNLRNDLYVEKIGQDKYKITDHGSKIGDVIVNIGEEGDTIDFLNELIDSDLLHKAYRIRQKIGDTKDSAYEEITKYIDKIKSPSTLADFKKSVEDLKKVIEDSEK